MRSKNKLWFVLGLIMLGLIAIAITSNFTSNNSDSSLERRTLTYLQPRDVKEPTWIEERKSIQLKNRKHLHVFSDFTFDDQLKNSNITFKNKMVDDAGKAYKPVHYDHGNGISVADIDNDGLYDIYFTNQVGSNELWLNQGNGTFTDITDKAGVGMQQQISVASSFADIDNDGDQDLFVTTVKFGNVLFENRGNGRFRDITKKSGLSYSGHSSGAVFFDYNRDGFLDLFLTNVGTYTLDSLTPIKGITREDDVEGSYKYYVGISDTAFTGHLYPELAEQSILYENKGNNTFKDVSQKTGLIDLGWAGDATTLDANGDGWPDLYVLNMQGDDSFYENVNGKRFEHRTPAYFPKTPYGSMGIKVFDFNNDGLSDVFITDMHSDMWETHQFFDHTQEKQKPDPSNIPPPSARGTDTTSIFGNALFSNEGKGIFTDITDEVGAEMYWPWGISTGDLNADGYDDVFITASMNFPYRYAVNSVLLNNNGQSFVDSEFILGVEPRKATAKLWYEIDCLRDDDEICDPFDNTITIDVWGAKGSRASVIFDLDDDGDLDIVTNEFNAEPQVLLSNLSTRKNLHFIKFKLIGTTSNRDGIGAIIEVSTANQVYKKVVDGKSGYLSQSDMPVYFGLGDNSEIDNVKVYWPSGITQEIKHPLKLNTLNTITEPNRKTQGRVYN